MDNNNDEIKLHMYQAAKIAIKREGSDGSIVAAWNIADENSGCSACTRMPRVRALVSGL